MKALILTITVAGSLALGQSGTETKVPQSQLPTKPPQNPIVVKPTDEGNETRVPDKQLNDLKKWAYNSLIALQNLKREAQNMPKPAAKDKLMGGIRAISQDADGHLNELLMKFTLNKALDIVTELENGMKTNYRFLDDAAVRVLIGFIDLAGAFYDSDVKLADKLVNGGDYEPEYLKYSIKVAEIMNPYVESVPDIATQYNLYFKMLGYFHRDMARMKRDKIVAPIVVPIDAFLHKSGIPESVSFDRNKAKEGREYLPKSLWVELPEWHKNLREMRKMYLYYYDLAIKTYELNKPI